MRQLLFVGIVCATVGMAAVAAERGPLANTQAKPEAGPFAAPRLP